MPVPLLLRCALRTARTPLQPWQLLLTRLRLAPQGFVCGTLTTSKSLTDESMSTHEPTGTTLCIHSVVTHEPSRRKGLGRWMMRSYMSEVARAAYVHRVLLLCKEPLVPFYESAGFANLGESGVEHGQDTWMLMANP